MGKYRQLLSDTFVFGIGNFLTKLISFFLMPIYTSDMTPEAFGLSDLLSNSLALCIPIFSFSIAEAVFRFALDEDSNKSDIFSTGLKVLTISYIVVIPSCSIVFSFTHRSWWILFGILYVTESLKILLAQFTRGLQNIRLFAISGIINAIFLFVFTYLFISLIKWQVDGYLLSFILSNIITIFYLAFSTKIWKYVNFGKHKISQEMLKYSIPLIPNTLSWWFTNVSSRYIIALFCGVSIAGLYSAASRIPALINVLASIFQQAWQYATVRQQQSKEEDNFFINVFNVYALLTLTIGSIIISLLPFISTFVLKGDFYKSWIYTPLLILCALIGCFSIFFGTFYQMLKRSKKIMNTTLAGAITNTILSLALVPIFGIWGALLASIIGYSVIVIYRVYDCRKILQIDFPLKMTIILFLVVALQSIILSCDFAYSMTISVIISCAILFYAFYHVYTYLPILIKFSKKS